MLTFVHSDRAVVRKVLGGNSRAFRVLVERYAGVVHGVAYARLKNSADAEDVAQETFIRFYQHLDQMAHRKCIGPWLVRVARNASVDLLRQRVRDAELREAQAPAALHVPNPVREEMHRMLWEQMDSLDPDAREVLVLHYFMKKKAREIAELLEITPDAAEKRVLRAREELGKRITDLLGDEIDEVKADVFRGDRIMAAVVAAPVAWKASAAGAAAAVTAAGVATGAGAAKLAGAAAVILLVCLLGYARYNWHTKPYRSQDITGTSSFTVEQNPAPATALAAAGQMPAPLADQAGDSAESEDGVGSGEPVYAPVFGVIRGTVTTVEGEPVAGAEVRLDNQEDLDTYERVKDSEVMDVEPVEPIVYTTRSDQWGEYALEGIELPLDDSLSRVRLRAKKGGLYGEASPEIGPLQREQVVDLVVCPDMVVGGIVTDPEGKPVKAFVATREQEDPSDVFRNHCVWAKEDGKFLIEHMAPGKCRLHASAGGFLPYLSPWIEVGTTDNVFTLDPGNSISGRVMERDTGRPVGGVYVSGRETSGNNMYRMANYFGGKTDAAGNFKISGCIAGNYGLSVSPERDAVLPYTLVSPLTLAIGNEPVTGLELKTATGGVLRGRIIDDETGRPPVGKFGLRATGKNNMYCKAEPDGRYELIGLPAGEVNLESWHQIGLNWDTRYSGSVMLAEGELRDNYDIHLPKRSFFTGLVVDEQGEPVPGASVFAKGQGSAFEAGGALTDVSGRFRLEPREDAPALLYFQAMTESGYSAPEGPYRLANPTGGIVLKLARSGRLEGEVVNKQGEPMSSTVICATPDSTDQLFLFRSSALDINDGESINALVKPGGRFSYRHLLPGRYTLHVYPFASVRGAPVAVTTVDIQAGRTVRARLVVDTSGFGAVEGTVTLDGKPLAGQQIFVRPVSAKWVCYLDEQTDADGHFEVRHILPGEAEVTLNMTYGPQQGIVNKQVAQIVSGEVARIDFDIAAGHACAEGYVLVDGLPAADVEVVFEPVETPGAGGPSAQSDNRGWYRVEGLAEGLYRVEATRTDFGIGPTHAIEAELAEGQTARLDFELMSGQIQGAVNGLDAGEKAFVALFPGDTQIVGWSAEVLDALGEQIIKDMEVPQNGPFSFSGLREGDYVVGAVALPAEGNRDTEAMLQGRLAVSPVVRVVPGSTAQIDLVFENR